MKKFIVYIVLISLAVFYLSASVNAQKKIFIRIYPTHSSNTIKGFYAGHTDSALIIISKHQPDTIFYSGIQQIRTRRSTGHNILISTLIGAIAGTATGVIAHKDRPPVDPNCQLCNIINEAFTTTQAEDAAGGAILGAAAGAAAGTITGLTKRKETLIVAGDFQNWKMIKTRLDAWPVYIPGTDKK